MKSLQSGQKSKLETALISILTAPSSDEKREAYVQMQLQFEITEPIADNLQRTVREMANVDFRMEYGSEAELAVLYSFAIDYLRKLSIPITPELNDWINAILQQV